MSAVVLSPLSSLVVETNPVGQVPSIIGGEKEKVNQLVKLLREELESSGQLHQIKAQILTTASQVALKNTTSGITPPPSLPEPALSLIAECLMHYGFRHTLSTLMVEAGVDKNMLLTRSSMQEKLALFVEPNSGESLIELLAKTYPRIKPSGHTELTPPQVRNEIIENKSKITLSPPIRAPQVLDASQVTPFLSLKPGARAELTPQVRDEIIENKSEMTPSSPFRAPQVLDAFQVTPLLSGSTDKSELSHHLTPPESQTIDPPSSSHHSELELQQHHSPTLETVSHNPTATDASLEPDETSQSSSKHSSSHRSSSSQSSSQESSIIEELITEEDMSIAESSTNSILSTDDYSLSSLTNNAPGTAFRGQEFQTTDQLNVYMNTPEFHIKP